MASHEYHGKKPEMMKEAGGMKRMCDPPEPRADHKMKTAKASKPRKGKKRGKG